ncbi:universal stress protein [Algivirga pacifica]|uniref:UspA domain-containing protein n=1 Tax=Algivirga pacifica TaxID=1162670 RepID=A0ABP9CXF4_9BACT
MNELQTILVALDLSEMDLNLIRYTLRISKSMDIKKIILLHVASENSLKRSKKQHDKILQQMKDTVAQASENAADHYAIAYEITEGEPVAQIQRVSKEQSCDIIVIGKKKIGDGTGTKARRLTRRSLCSVLTLTEVPASGVNKILLPIDFYEMSQRALKSAINFCRKSNASLTCLHITKLPTGYHTSGKSPEEYANILKEHAEKRFQNLLKTMDAEDLSIDFRVHFDQTNSKGAKIIFNIALVEDADIIVMGSRGRSTIAATLLGSTTEKLLVNNISIPTLVIKNKEKNLGFFEALLKI